EDLREGFNVMAIALQQTHQYLAKQVENATAQYRIAMKALKDKNIELGKIGELAVAQNEIKSQFLAHISHEIRTPMNGIIGFADLLTKSPLSVQQYEQTQLIKNSALNLLSIVNEILDFSSLEAGSFSLNHKFSSIRTCLEETACLFNSYANQSKIILDIDNDIPSRVYIDPVRLQQVATNLLGNAVKFAEKGKIVVRCHLLKTGAPKPWILITVSDNGPGVSKRNEVRLFSPFLLLSDYAINHESGTGLGLHISKNIVERLNGKMGVKTLENIGSTFWFAFPVIDQQTVPISTNHQNLILICPDPLNRSAFKKQLGNLGFSVYCYDSLSSYLEKKPLTINLVFFHSLTHNENVSSIYKTYSVIKSTTQAPVVYLYQQKQLPNINPVIPTLQLPCRSKYLSTFIDSVIKKGEIQPIEQKHAPQIIASSPDFTILLADDNEINRILLKSQIEPFSRNISIANDGREALKLLMDRKYDLIFLDLQMPKISGMELIKKIKKADCINFATPVLAITAHAQKEQRDAVIKAGFDECLIKPVLADQISEAIERLLKIVSGNPNRSRYEPSDEDYVQGMLEKTQNNKQLAKTLFEKLFQELPEQIKTIKSALALGNTVLAKETTHKLHGSVSFCGLARLQQKAEKMENSFLSGNIRQIQPFFDALEKEVNQFLNQRSEISDTFSDV
ncbi:MAG: response regulator, partial [Gammaproteobacteria bacterium]